MRAGQAFLAGTVALGLCLAVVGSAAAKNPFTLTSAVLSETVDTTDSLGPVDCADYPAASDYYVWTANLTNISGNLKTAFVDNPVILAFVSNSCTPLTAAKVTNTLEFPPNVATAKTNKSTGVITITFTGALPDFNTVNTANSTPLSFFDYMELQLQYNPATKTGTLQVSGNANLCDSLAAGAPQCLLLDTVDGFSCSCNTLPTVNQLDVTSLFQ